MYNWIWIKPCFIPFEPMVEWFKRECYKILITKKHIDDIVGLSSSFYYTLRI